MARTSPGRACVIGAGIQGITAALALAADGWSVTVLERSAHPFRGASFRGEGKLHLGYVYTNDPTGRTARLMVDAALQFGGLLDTWLREPVDWASARSPRFGYAVLEDTMVAPDILRDHYAMVDEMIAARLATGSTYAGRTAFRPTEVLDHPGRHGYSDRVAALVQTDEVALDPAVIRQAIDVGIAAHDIDVLTSTEVVAVHRTANGFDAACRVDERPATHHADIVVNCAWDGRLSIDETLGITPARSWSYRLKYGVRGRLRAGSKPPPTTTFVLGPFGDVVSRSTDDIYLSWYPDCLAGWSTDLEIPDDWLRSMGGADPTQRQDDVAARTTRALTQLIPGLASVEPISAAAGVIVAWGDTDIDDRDSVLHRRDDVGVHDHDGYFSIDTGKLTCAPMHAADLIRRLR